MHKPDARSEKEKMLAGDLYDPSAPEIQADLAATMQWLTRYNASLALPAAERRALLAERLGAVGPGSLIRPPFIATTASTSAWARAFSSTSIA